MRLDPREMPLRRDSSALARVETFDSPDVGKRSRWSPHGFVVTKFIGQAVGSMIGAVTFNTTLQQGREDRN
ncbi:hypothetical protein Bpfe_028624 [Biomphalaria pfeifferi]|uniref:Uncharacterized protein n=1 Tax=Biomphalaria pfeifferi TaxID=112525 RepID=A0AAD8AUH8_BIOPF|nr:hypothetical protein Bpfe_028624 [Biomphalaria pfeifferi]